MAGGFEGVFPGAIVPDQEYLLQGSIMDGNPTDILLHRLRGLCDNVDAGLEPFQEHEMIFSIRPGGTPQSASFSLRVRRALDQGIDGNNALYQLRYIGNPEIGDKNRPTLVRSCLDVACTSNVVEFLKEMGFRIDYEFMLKGHFFRKGRMKVIVAKILRMVAGKQHMDPLEAMSMSSLVEISVVAPKGQEQLAEDMRAFADQLKPLVQLEKHDARRFQVT